MPEHPPVSTLNPDLQEAASSEELLAMAELQRQAAAEAPLEAPETKLEFAVVDQTVDAERKAHDYAVERRAEWLNDGKGFKRFTKGVWDSVAGDFMQLRTEQKAARVLREQGDLYALDDDQQHAQRSKQAIIDRFTSEYEETVHREAGEQRETLANEDPLAVATKELIGRSTTEGMSDEALREEYTRVLQAHYDQSGPEAFGEGKVTADNLMSIRDAVIGAVEHGESLDRVLENMSITVGESRSGARTEAYYSKTDKVIERLSKSKFGSLVGPETVAATATIAASLLKMGSQRLVGAAAMTIVPGAGAGVWAGLRENKRTQADRAKHARDMAEGGEIIEGSKRREEMEVARYETASAADMIADLGSYMDAETGLVSADATQRAIESLAAIETRIAMSDRQKIDLISYEKGQVEDQRLALDIARAEVKAALAQSLDEEARVELDIQPGATVQDLVESHADEFMNSIDQDVSAKDQAFKKLKARRVAKAAVAGVVTGVLIGGVAQEGIAALDDSRQGLVEQLWGAHSVTPEGELSHQTILTSLVDGETGPGASLHHEASSEIANFSLGESDVEYQVSADHTIVENGDGTVNFVDVEGGVTVENLPINPDGSMPDASKELLEAKGMSVIDQSEYINQTETHEAVVSPAEFVMNHENETTAVTRELWYDNNTGAADGNELATHWGGVDGSGITETGYQLSVAAMTADGSSAGGESVNWATAAQEGSLKFAVSATVDTQTQVFMVDIAPDGTIDIPADSPAGQFFEDRDGTTVFTGAYGEVVQTTSVHDTGELGIRPLGTLVGTQEASSITDTITTTTQVMEHSYQITTGGYETPVAETFTEMAPVIPIVSRRPLERLAARPAALIEARRYPYQNSYLSPEELQVAREETSPRLLGNPDADLNPREEIDFYRDLVATKRGSEYVAGLEEAIASSPELQNINPNLETIIKVPVNAAGDREADTIYRTLAAYAEQDADAVSRSMVLMHVNWRDDAMDDPDTRARIEKTKSEIERARADFPGLKIATFETEWEKEKYQDGVIGFIGGKLNDVATFAVGDAMRGGQLADDRDVLLIRNDADAAGMSLNYLGRYAAEAQKNPQSDIFTGVTTFDNLKSKRLPGFAFAANFMQGLGILKASRYGNVHTAGANFGVRVATLSAVGGIGFNDEYLGAGSDDVNIGRRIVSARKGAGEVSSGTRGTTYYGGNSQQIGSTRKVAVQVAGARVDTDSDREEVLYLQNIPIVNTWNPEHGFDNGGYKNRDEGLQQLRAAFEEDLRKNPDIVVERVRADIENSLSVFASPSEEGGRGLALSALALAFALPGGRPSTDAYTLTEKTVGTGDEARIVYGLTLTDIGKKFLANHLTRDRKGRFDSYGARKHRQMYGEVQEGARRQATHQSIRRV